MKPRDRVLIAMGHQEPDRIPLDLGGPANTLSPPVAKSILRSLNLPKQSFPVWNPVQQLIELPEGLLQHYQIDTRHVHAVTPFKHPNSTTIIDWLGFPYQKIGSFYTLQNHPLAKAKTKADLDQFEWPKPQPAWFRKTRAKARKHFENGFAVVADPSSPGIFELGCWLMGWPRFLALFHRNPDLASYVIVQSTDMLISFWENFCSAVGDYINIVIIGDDYGTETQSFMSPVHFRKYLKPSLQRLLTSIKRTTHVAILLHSCGAITPLIPDLIESGVDILSPIQPSATGMDPTSLKAKFKHALTFHGGVDLHYIQSMPKSEAAVILKRQVQTLATGGGYIFGFTHPILETTQLDLFHFALNLIQ